MKLVCVVFISLCISHCEMNKETPKFQSYEQSMKERLLRNKYEEWKMQYKFSVDNIKHAQSAVTDSKAKTIALSVALELLSSIDTVFPKSANNMEKEWSCEAIPEAPVEFKFQTLKSYSEADGLYLKAKTAAEILESKINAMIGTL